MNKSRRTTQQKSAGSPKGSGKRRSNGVHLTELGLEKFLKSKSDYFLREISPSDEDEYLSSDRKQSRSLNKLALAIPTSPITLTRFFNRENVAYDTAWAIADTLGFTRDEFHACVEERSPGRTLVSKRSEVTSATKDGSDTEQAQPEGLLLADNSKPVASPTDAVYTEANAEIELNLLLKKRHQLYQALQEQTNTLTSSPLLGGTEPGRSRKDLFIPLKVVRREKISQHFSRPQQSTFEIPAEVDREETTALALETLLKQLLENSADSQSSGLRIAIVGDAGAGKTTFLQEFAEKIFEPPPEPEFGQLSNSIAIWVSLADLKGTLEEYLLGEWLETALKQRHIDEETEDALEDLCQRKKVWLLLDGLDEYPNSSDSVSKLLKQLKGWLSTAHVVLTCRPHLWTGGRNELNGFEVYQILDFGQPASDSSDDLIDAFLCKWWANEPESLRDFRSELNDPRNAQTHDLARNPLLLTLLCKFWQILRESLPSSKTRLLPSTKVELYRGFTETINSWKRTELTIIDFQAEELNQALAQLALQAIDEGSQFSLQEDLVKENFSSNPGLLQLAVDTGWLRRVQLVANRRIENIYTFLHPSFQEYFASLAIPDRSFFLPIDHQNKPVPDKKDPSQYDPYRAFDRRWMEVILFWLGRHERQVKAKEKTLFILSMMQFDDGCANFFDRSYLPELAYKGYQAFEAYVPGLATSNSTQENSSTVLLYDGWEHHFLTRLNEDWLSIAKKYETKLIKLLGYWMHCETCMSEPVKETELLSKFDVLMQNVKFMGHGRFIGHKFYQKNKEKVERWKNEFGEELEAIDTLDTSALVEKLQNSDRVLIRGKVIINLLERCNSSEELITELFKLNKKRPNLNFGRSIAWILAEIDIEQPIVIEAMHHLLAQYDDSLVKVAIADHYRNLTFDDSTSVEVLQLIIASSKYCYSKQCQENFVWSSFFHDIIIRCSTRLQYTQFYDAWHNPTSAL